MWQRRQKVCDLIIVILWLLCLCSFFIGCNAGEEKEGEAVFNGEAVTEGQQEDIKKVPEEENDDAFESRNETEEDSKNMIYVHVCGQVVNPGVYELCPGDRVTHAIHAAGGMTEDASSAFLNLAALLEDGQKIYVPTEAEADQFLSQGTSGSDSMPGDWKQSTAGIGQNENTSEDAKVNLNTAGKAELMTLSGIGESRAEAIITYRQEYGRFESIEDIKNIEGIKDGIFNRIKDQLTV